MSISSETTEVCTQEVTNIVLNEHLKCLVCLEFAVSPIYTCHNTHLVCGICQANIEESKCPTCERELFPNEFLDVVLKTQKATFPCRNIQHGCLQRIQPSEMKVHLTSSCDFRKIMCAEIISSRCKHESYHPKDLLQHWKEVHGMLYLNFEYPLQNSSSSTYHPKNLLQGVYRILKSNLYFKYPLVNSAPSNFLGSLSRSLNLPNDCLKSGTTPRSSIKWPLSYFKIDDRKFISHIRGSGQLLHMWITLLGSESDAIRYKYSVTLSSNLSESKQKEVTFNEIPVHSIQYYDVGKAADLGDTVSVGYQFLKLLKDKEPTKLETAYEWNLIISIYRAEKEGDSSIKP